MQDHQEGRLGQRFGEYRLVHKLGGGAFGTVYLAEHVHEQTQAAVKVLDIRLSKTEDFKDFINEVRTILLRHPHIMPLLDFGISRDDLPYLVMEYAPEGTLRDRHPQGVRVPLSTIVSYVDQLASALQYAHDQRVIHRDIKPENILVRADGTLLMSDFGIAKLLEQSVLLSIPTQAGTPVYMAPEQHLGYPCFASDQYALAVVIYEWICGVRPFQGTTFGVAVQHLNTPPQLLRKHVPELPEDVERIVLKALAKAPEDRFERIQDFADALHEAAQPLLNTMLLSSPIEARNTAPFIPPEQVSRLATGPKTDTSWGALTGKGSARRELAIQTAEVLVSHQRSVPARYSSLQDPPQITKPPSLKKHRLSRRPLLLVGGGALGLLLLPAIIRSIITVQRGSSSPPKTQQNVSPAHSDQVAQKWVFSTGSPVASLPTIVDGMLYVGSQDGNVYALDAGTGQKKWAFPTGRPVASSPTVVNGVLYVSSWNSSIYALDAGTGQKKWAFSTGGIVDSSPTVVNSVLYVGSEDSSVYAIDTSTGQQRWAFPTGQSVVSSPTVVNGTLYVSSRDGNMYALDANTGQQDWVFPTGDAVASSPTVINGVLYIGSGDHNVYAIDASTGQQKWVSPTGALVRSAPTMVNGVVYVGSEDSSVYAIDAYTGQQKWVFPTRGPVDPSPMVVNGVVYIGSGDHNVYAIDASTGQQKWAFSTGNVVSSAPIAVNGVLYIGSGDHNVYAIDASTGQQKWAFPTGGSVQFSPTVVNGVLYVGSWDGKVYALTLPGQR
jgi:eukaryotic-like serine/threonine-protein kinase